MSYCRFVVNGFGKPSVQINQLISRSKQNKAFLNSAILLCKVVRMFLVFVYNFDKFYTVLMPEKQQSELKVF